MQVPLGKKDFIERTCDGKRMSRGARKKQSTSDSLSGEPVPLEAEPHKLPPSQISNSKSQITNPDCLSLLRGETAVLGLSGGRDSVALLFLLHEQGVRVHALHVHHGIRGAAADADAAFCRELCGKLGVPFEEQRADVPALAAQRGESLETAARVARRAALADCARRVGTRFVVLAHHADDNAETVLFRLARGAAGYRGMLPMQETQGICWLRPLLETPRAALTQYLHARGQGWVEDATNAVPDAARNCLRLEVLPALNRAMGRDVAPVLTRSARMQAETLAALESALALLPLTDPQGRLYLPALLGQKSAFRKAVLHRYLSRAGVPELSEELILAVDALLSPEAPAAQLNLPGNLFARRKEKRLVICEADGKMRAVVWGV